MVNNKQTTKFLYESGVILLIVTPVIATSLHVALAPIESWLCIFWFHLRFLLAFWSGLYLITYFDGSEYHAERFVQQEGWGDDSLLTKLLLRRVSLKVVYDDPQSLTKLGQHILAVHPHGIFSLNHFFVSMGVCGIASFSDPRNRRGLAARVLFKIPGIREWALRCNWVDAGKETAERCLRKGFSLSIVPGGEREMLMTKYGDHTLVLKQRNGFIKLALKHYADLVPIFCFGETELIHNPTFLYSLRSKIQKLFGVVIFFPFSTHVWKVFGLSISIPLPYIVYKGSKLTLVVGKPIKATSKITEKRKEQNRQQRFEVPKLPCQNGFVIQEFDEDDVTDLHEKYVAAVKTLFDKHKRSCGYSDAVLKIV